MKIETFDKATCRMIAREIEQAVAAVAEKYGVSVAYKGGSFDASTFKPKIELSVVAPDGVVATPERRDFEDMALLYGLAATDLGREFQSNGSRFTICGAKPRSPKRPILAKRSDGQVFKFSPDAVKSALERTAR